MPQGDRSASAPSVSQNAHATGHTHSHRDVDQKRNHCSGWHDRFEGEHAYSPFFPLGCLAEKGTVPICRNGPKGASHKWGLSPFPLVGSDSNICRNWSISSGFSRLEPKRLITRLPAEPAKKSSTNPPAKKTAVSSRLSGQVMAGFLAIATDKPSPFFQPIDQIQDCGAADPALG